MLNPCFRITVLETLTVSKDTLEIRNGFRFDSFPVWDGLAEANGQRLLSSRDGQDGLRPPQPRTIATDRRPPELLTIPSGRGRRK